MQRYVALRWASRSLGQVQRVPVRQTSRSRVNARPLSSTSVISESYTLAVPLMKEHTEENTPIQSIQTKRQPHTTQTSVTYKRCVSYIQQNNYMAMFTMLKKPSLITTSELEDLVRSLRSMYLHKYVLEIFHIFPQQVTESPELLRLVLTSAYNVNDYTLFEDLFSSYIQHPTLSAEFFNMALAVFLKTNTEFAKQLLYQMITAHYPMNENTIYVFLKYSVRVGTFPIIRFALDLIKNNPQVPMTPRAYNQLVTGFINGAGARDMAQLSEYLRSVGMEDHKEVQMAYMLNEIKSCDVEEAWRRASNFEFIDVEMRRRCYEFVYQIMYKRMNVNDYSKYLSLLKDGGIKETPEVHMRILESLGRGQMTLEILHYITLTKRQHNLKLNKFYYMALWRSLVTSAVDDSKLITQRFRHFVMTHKRDIPWATEALDELVLDKTNHGKLARSKLFHQRYLQITELLESKDERALMHLVNSHLRAGIRPPIPMLKMIMEGFSKIHSSKDMTIYQLIRELHPVVPVDVEISVLKKELTLVNNKKKPATGAMLIRCFIVNYAERLHVGHYNELAKIAIGLRNYKLTIELVAKARTSESYRIDKNTIRLYDTALRALAHNGEPSMLFSLMNHVANDNEVILSTQFCQNLKRYGKLVCKRLPEDQVTIFQKDFDESMKLIKNKYNSRRASTGKVVTDTMEFLAQWIGESRKQ